MPDIENLKNATTVARNLMRARNEYKASPDFLPDAIIRMDNIVSTRSWRPGFLMADDRGERRH